MTKELEVELRRRIEKAMKQFHGEPITDFPSIQGVSICKVKNVLSEVVEKFLKDYNLEIKIPSDVYITHDEIIIIKVDTTEIDKNETI